jgi:hypothetical protein
MKRFVLAVGLLAAFLLTGCGARLWHTAPSDLEFDSKSEKSVVIIGVGSGGKRLRPSGLFSTSMQDPYFRLTWVNLDSRDDALGVDFYNVQGVRPHVSGDGIIYHVTLIKPGRYLLVDIVEDEKNGNNYVTRRTDVTKANIRLAFIAKPGEVLYVGDFTVDASQFPADLKKYARNEKEAREAIAKYPGIKPEMKSLPVLPLPGVKREDPKPL